MSDHGSATAEARTNEALAGSGFADMRPSYRQLLRRLKKSDAAAFEEATRHYHEKLVPAIAGEDEEPIAAWAAYGAWLARRLAPGRLVALDETGLATRAEPGSVSGRVLLYLPEDDADSAIPLLRPAEPSTAQQAALDLLVR